MFFLLVIVATLLFTFIEPLLPYEKEPNTIYYSEQVQIDLFTRQPKLDENGEPLLRKYGASTTWMGKLTYRLDSRRNGGCPILAVGIKKGCIEGYDGAE